MHVVAVVGVPPEGYTVRAPRQDDLVSVTGLIGAAERADLGSSFYSSDLVAEDWSLPGFDLASDAWLAIHLDGQLAGYGWVHRPTAKAPFFGQATVHPAHRGRGIGALLLGLRERRARAPSPPGRTSLLPTVVPGPDAAGRRLADGQGYRFARTFWHLAVKRPAANHGPAHPTEVDIRQFARGRDERLVHEVFEQAFTGLWRFAPMAFQEWSALRIEWEGFDPSLWLVAQYGTHVVGALAGRIVDGIGWVSTLGVRPHHR